MLNKLRRKKTARLIFFTLLILILPAFVFWGFGSYIRNKQEAALRGKVSGREISDLEYRDALEAVRAQVIMQFGERLDEIAKFLDLEGMAKERILLLSEAKKRHIRVSDKEVIEAIRGYPFFEINGKFNNKYYLETLQYVFHAQPRIFEEHTRQNLILSKFYQNITDKVALSDTQIREEYRKANEEASIYYITARAEDFSKDARPDEDNLKKYFEANRIQFKEPLSFNLQYLTVGSGKDNAESLKKNLQKAIQELRSSRDINKSAKALGLEVKETGFFSLPGPIPGLGWSPQLENLILKSAVKKYLPPVAIDEIYYLVMLKERREAHLPEFQNVKDKVKLAFIKEEGLKIARARISACLEKLKEQQKKNPKSPDFEKAAKALNLKSAVTQSFKYGSYIEGIGGSDIFWDQVQNLKDGAFSNVIEVPSGFYIIRVKSRTFIDDNKFKAESKGFTEKLLGQKKQEAFGEFLSNLKKQSQFD